MNRKDTIIIAILVNAALLVALFVSAIKKEREEPKMASVTKESVFEKPLELPRQQPQNAIKAASGDEVDLVLKEFTQNQQNLAAGPSTGKEGNAMPVFSFAEASDAAGVKNENEIRPSSAFAQDPFVSFNQSSAPQDKSEEGIVQWTVKKGDALEKIARANKTSVEEIMKLNDLKGSSLRIGQVLKVKKNSSHQKGSDTASSPKESSPKFYTVKTGDNPWTIAVKNQLKLEELLKLNNLNEEKARRLKPGDELRIR